MTELPPQEPAAVRTATIPIRTTTTVKAKAGTGKKTHKKGKRRYHKKKKHGDFGIGLGVDYEDRLADEREERRVTRAGVDRT